MAHVNYVFAGNDAARVRQSLSVVLGSAPGCPEPARQYSLVRIVKRKLKKIQYRPHLIDGCLAGTGLKIEPW